tara:strand:+ start:4082 stop:5188 length:1107 start_codon:yes stop_codon:yes gene_type:complete
MKTKAAVVWKMNDPWEIVELDLDEPQAGELLVRFVATGLCHSDEHLRIGSVLPRYPMVGGHEGGGIVEAVGPGVTDFEVGDHVVTSFMPSCGKCASCRTGHPNLCELGALLMQGTLPSGGFRFHGRSQDIGGMCLLGTFSEHAVISEHSAVKVDSDIPLDVACLVGCGVPTGWGSAVNVADVRPGDTVVVYGVGGVGMNAVQGAHQAGALRVVAVDPVPDKQEWARDFGATHTFGTAAEAHDLVVNATRGQMARSAILTIGHVQKEDVQAAVAVVGKNGRVVLTGQSHVLEKNVEVEGFSLLGYERQIIGTTFGSCRPHVDIPRLLEMYREGAYKLDELITHRYTLEQINEAYEAQARGELIRGVIEF